MTHISFTAAQIAEHLRGEVVGDGSVQLTGFAPADSAKAGDLTFAEKQSYFAAAEQSAATAILINGDFISSKKVLIRVPNARIAMARVLPLFYPPEKQAQGIHPSAIIDPTAQIDPTAYIGPHCVISAGVRIGARSALLSGDLRDLGMTGFWAMEFLGLFYGLRRRFPAKSQGYRLQCPAMVVQR